MQPKPAEIKLIWQVNDPHIEDNSFCRAELEIINILYITLDQHKFKLAPLSNNIDILKITANLIKVNNYVFS